MDIFVEGEKPHIRLPIDLGGPDGNAFAVIGIVASVLAKMGKDKKEINAYQKDALSGDYAHCLATSAKHIEIIDSSESYEFSYW